MSRTDEGIDIIELASVFDKCCVRYNISNVEFSDSKGNEYCGCYGLEDAGPGVSNPECLECRALAWKMDQEVIEWAVREAAKHQGRGRYE